MEGLKSLVEYFIDDGNEVEEFALWAFGKTYKQEVGLINFMKLWNQFHSDIFELNSSGQPKQDMKKMVELWKKHKEVDI